jgi:hypothetical protein
LKDSQHNVLTKKDEKKHNDLPEHLSSPPAFSVVRVTRSLVWCVCFVDRCLSLCTFGYVEVISLTVATMTVNHKWPRICSVCHNHNPVLSSFMTYHLSYIIFKERRSICNCVYVSLHTCIALLNWNKLTRLFTASIKDQSMTICKWANRFMTYHGVTRVTRRVQHVEQELRTYLSEAHDFTLGFCGGSCCSIFSPPAFSVVRVTRSLVWCVCFVDRCLSLLSFIFWPLYWLSFFDL